MDWELLHTLEIAARTGSFAAAAREMGIEHTTVRRRIQALEDELGRPLFDRTARGLVPTEAGAAAVEEVRRMAGAAEAAAKAASQAGTELAGPVRISVSPIHRRLVLTGLAPLLRAHPAVQLDVVEGRAYADLTRREADLALRSRPLGVPPADDDTPVRRLGDLTFGVYVPVGWEGRPLHEAPVIRHNEHSPGDLPATYLATLPAQPPVAALASGIVPVAELVECGIGWSVLPDLGPEGWPGAVRVADSGVRYAMWLAFQGSRRRHPAVRLVAEAIATLWPGRAA